MSGVGGGDGKGGGCTMVVGGAWTTRSAVSSMYHLAGSSDAQVGPYRCQSFFPCCTCCAAHSQFSCLGLLEGRGPFGTAGGLWQTSGNASVKSKCRTVLCGQSVWCEQSTAGVDCYSCCCLDGALVSHNKQSGPDMLVLPRCGTLLQLPTAAAAWTVLLLGNVAGFG